MQGKSGLSKFYSPWFIVPALAMFTVFFIIPNVASFVLAFTDWSLFYFNDMRFNGLANFQRLFSEPNFWICIRNTFHFATVTVIGKTLLGFLFALLVQREGKVNRGLRSVIFLPITISSIVVAIVFVSIYNPSHVLLNSFLSSLGLDGLRQDWLFNPKLSMWSICLMEIWQWTGFNMLIFIAGLKNIPKDYYEAAEIDGATYWQRTMRITVPLIAHSFTVTFINSISARESYNTQTAASLAAQLDQLTEQMDIIACQVLASSELQSLMHAAAREADAANYFDRGLDARRNAQRILWLFNSPMRVVQAINVLEGRSFVGLLNAPPQGRIDQVSALDCWKVPDRGSFLIAPHMDDWLQITDRPVLSLVRAFNDTSSSFDRIGTIEVQVTVDAIDEALRVEDEGMQTCILDGEGKILYPCKLQGIAVELPDGIGEQLSFTDAQGVPSIGAQAGLEKYDWKVLFFQPESVYRAAMLRSMILPVGMGLVLILLAVAVFLLISRSFTHPIRQLTQAVQGVTLENADALRALDSSTEEIDTLRDAFLERGEQLQDAAKQLVSASESELRLKLSVLQAHINPHFLYNSLMAISAAGQEGSAERVEDMCYQLAELYRYHGFYFLRG